MDNQTRTPPKELKKLRAEYLKCIDSLIEIRDKKEKGLYVFKLKERLDAMKMINEMFLELQKSEREEQKLFILANGKAPKESNLDKQQSINKL
jgi:hypothetical protein